MFSDRFHEFSFWSPVLGSQALRISMADDHGAEHFVIVPVEPGRKLREARIQALGALSTNITAGRPPGEVKVELSS